MPSVTLRHPQTHEKIVIPHYPVDMVGTDERAASFSKRSLKKQSKMDLLKLAIRMTDLTTLEGMDTPGKVEQLCYKAIRPCSDEFLTTHHLTKHLAKTDFHIPSVGAVCVYPEMVPTAHRILKGTGVHLASVATSFPSGQVPLNIKLADVKKAIDYGADEIDMVIDRGAFLRGDYQKVFNEIVAVKEICRGRAHLKVILETGELKTYDNVRLASWMAMEAGGDFIKTSTGKVTPAATMPVTLVMLQAIQDFYDEKGVIIGMKPAGGIRTAKQAIAYLVMVKEVLGEKWMTPDLFRFGASALLNDLLRQIFKQVSGHYLSSDLFSLD